MVLPQPQRSLYKLLILSGVVVCLAGQSCSHKQKIFKSECDDDKHFKQVTFKHLMDSLKDYDHKYVEVLGKYEEGKEQSALVIDSLLDDQSNKNALWVDFSQDCPLYLAGTHTGLFEYNDSGFTQLKDKAITIRGKIDLHNKGHLKQYKAAIERVSYIKF
ncbi:MAG TPA: hypothetical protein VK668_06270 [Mucilaginibacter sp.]|nr:hypothetical protein [Mucilaginibacter sp.]